MSDDVRPRRHRLGGKRVALEPELRLVREELRREKGKDREVFLSKACDMKEQGRSPPRVFLIRPPDHAFAHELAVHSTSEREGQAEADPVGDALPRHRSL